MLAHDPLNHHLYPFHLSKRILTGLFVVVLKRAVAFVFLRFFIRIMTSLFVFVSFALALLFCVFLGGEVD